jgi:acyl-CoA synthetase (AMP-forming)/AMP-acid ligase II
VLEPNLFTIFTEEFSENLFSLYGSTETISFGTALLHEDIAEDNLDSVGKPGPNVGLHIIVPNSRDSWTDYDQGEIGEIILRSPARSHVVWDDPERTIENSTRRAGGSPANSAGSGTTTTFISKDGPII